MTDLVAPLTGFASRRLDTTSDGARARLRARYRAEARFRWLGVGALAVTAVFLVVLIADILVKGLPAFWQHHVVLDVPVAADVVDPEGKRTPEALRAGDYMGVARRALAAAMPGFEGRTARKQLNEILSSGAADELREAVSGNPGLVGQTVEARLLLSDNADLYLKGVETEIASAAGTKGMATPTGTAGEIKVLLSANDLAGTLASVKTALAVRAEALEDQANALEQSGRKGVEESIGELRAQAKALRGRHGNADAAETLDGTMPSRLIAINGGLVKITTLSSSEATGEALVPLASADDAKPGTWQIVTYETPEDSRNINDRSIAILETLRSQGRIERSFNTLFFTSGDSREPELAGIRGALVGSFLTLLVTIGLCLPIGVMAAIYLEEFAPKNRFTDFVEININNLAAVPSIVFGLLGLAVFLNFIGLPRSAPLVGGLVLALLVLPTIIIASRAALRAVPPSIREAALGVGASKQQAILHHVLPLAMPGIMTGTIIGMAHALGETAPLLLIGMVAFIVDVPKSFSEAATVLPVQIFLWSDLPEPAFQAKTAAAIIVLLAFLFLMNGTAIWLRRKFERRW
jgi:phosphate transport system permease protein